MTSHVYSTAAARWKPKLYVRVASSLVTITIIIILAASTTMKDSYGDIIQPALLACFVLGPPAIASFIMSSVDIAFILLRRNHQGMHSVTCRVLDMFLTTGWLACLIAVFVIRAAHPWHEHWGVSFAHEKGDGFLFSSAALAIVAFGLHITAFALTVKQANDRHRNEILRREYKPDPNCDIPRIGT